LFLEDSLVVKYNLRVNERDILIEMQLHRLWFKRNLKSMACVGLQGTYYSGNL